MRIVGVFLLVLNVFFLAVNLASGSSIWWVSTPGILFALVTLYFDSQSRKAKRRIRELNDAWTANWADRHGR